MSGPPTLKYAREQWRAIVICLFVTIGAFQFGYDSSYFSGILAMQPFIRQYGGTLDPNTHAYVLAPRLQSIVTSIINVGEFLGAAASFIIGDCLGRRGGLLVAMVCVVVGTVFQISDAAIGMLIAGRLILGFAVGLISCMVPLLVADCAPARFRGSLVTMYQNCIGWGLLLGVIIDNATKGRTDSGSYQIPMAVQLIFPIILVPALLTFIPESPRWLLAKFKNEKARKALVRLNGDRPDVVDHEIETIGAAIERDNAAGKSSWAEIFRKGPEGRKAYLGFALQALQQATGINFITGYGIIFFLQVGIDNPFIIQIGLYLVAVPIVFFSAVAVDKFGRRPMLMCSGLLTAAVLIIVGACGLVPDKTHSLSQVIVAMVYIFLVVFNLSWGPTVWVVASEIATGKSRGKLMAISTCSNWFFNWLVSFTFPYLFDATAGNLGAKIGFVYGSLTLFAVVWVFFFLPETAGRTLEDIHAMFEQHVPARQFSSYVIEAPQTTLMKDQYRLHEEAKVAVHQELETVQVSRK